MRVRFTAAARSELRETIDYYNEQRPGLGAEFHAAVNDALKRIRQLPNAWPLLGPNIRRRGRVLEGEECHRNRQAVPREDAEFHW